MPRHVKDLTALEVKNLKKAGLHFVGEVAGLALQIAPGGSKSWVLRATMGNKRREMGLGGYPDVTLAGAREAARQARAKIKAGIDPIDDGKAARSALAASRAKDVTFEKCALDYIHMHEAKWKPKSHSQWLSSLNKHVFPKIGKLMVRDVDTPQVLDVLKPIWNTLTETATRVRGRMEKILNWATVQKLRAGQNPAAWDGHLEAILPAPEKIAQEEHFAALPYKEVGSFMQRLRERPGQGARCLEFAILTCSRSTEARGARWSEINLDEAVWILPKERMGKNNQEHRVPLSKEALALIRAQPVIDEIDFVFPGSRGGMVSDATLGAVLKRMKVPAVPHGFRSSFKDWATEMTEHRNDLSEMALSHKVGSKVEQAYRRGTMFQKRRLIMQDWADFCGREWDAKKDAVVIAMKEAA